MTKSNEKEKKSKPKKTNDNKKYIIFTCIIVLVVVVIGTFAIIITTDKPKKTNIKKNEVNISGYGIYLDDSDTDLYREEYKKLESILTKKEIDKKGYAEGVAKLFIIDLYTIDNKINKYDVGGIDFVYPEKLENYNLNVTNTLYNYVVDNSDFTRTQSLPEVSSIEIKNTEETTYKIEDENKEYKAYKFKLEWNYKKDLGYDKSGEVIVIDADDKMYVVEKN